MMNRVETNRYRPHMISNDFILVSDLNLKNKYNFESIVLLIDIFRFEY